MRVLFLSLRKGSAIVTKIEPRSGSIFGSGRPRGFLSLRKENIAPAFESFTHSKQLLCSHGHFVSPRKGSVRSHYFHSRKLLENICSRPWLVCPSQAQCMTPPFEPLRKQSSLLSPRSQFHFVQLSPRKGSNLRPSP
jgi:hypothetical protein